MRVDALDQHLEDAVTGGRPDAAKWRRSRSCNGGSCVEAAPAGERIAVRDSGNPGRIIMFSASSWREFIARIKNGEFGNGRQTEP